MRVIPLLLFCATIHPHSVHIVSTKPKVVVEDGIVFLVYPDGTWVWTNFSLRWARRKPEPSSNLIEPDVRESFDYDAEE
jgi:hypothetical protein